MKGSAGHGRLEPDLRAELEALLRRVARAGHIPDRGEREIRIRLKPDDHISWFEAHRVRVPGTELSET